jgi:hypothetical protein
VVKKKKRTFTDKEMKYGLAKWKDLPIKVRRAVKDLDYDEAKWDGAERVHVSHQHWHHMTEAGIKSLEVLGWEEQAWEHQYEHHAWKDLPELQKKAATAAGFTEEIWDDDDWPENLEKYWEALSEEDKHAMAVLGWTENSWN